jgi:hypothetical protein
MFQTNLYKNPDLGNWVGMNSTPRAHTPHPYTAPRWAFGEGAGGFLWRGLGEDGLWRFGGGLYLFLLSEISMISPFFR